MTPALIPVALLVLRAACSSNNSSSAPPTAEALRESSRAAAATIDNDWLASRLAVLAGDEMEGRDNLTAGGAKARAWLESEMIAIGLEPMGIDSFEQPFEQGINLVGRIAGSDPSVADEYVVVSGRYDHLGVVGAPRSQCRASRRAPGDTICNGAADNAAGSVATLAVANALAHSRLGTRRSILIVFWDAEEDGLPEIDIVSFDKLTQISRQVTLMTADVANDEGRPGFVEEPVPQLDDARALLALGKVVQADPSSLGLDDPLLIRVLNGWIERLERYVANPPTTDAGWNAYQTFVKEIITTIYSVIGGEA